MQAALSLSPSFIPIVTPTKTLALAGRITPRLQTPLCPSIKVTPATNDTSTVDYSSMTSVLPAEACETIGGDACDAEMYPEVKPKPEIQSSKAKTSSEPIDREYLDYSSPKTVFPGEACDDLGGEFCEPEYQEGVY